MPKQIIRHYSAYVLREITEQITKDSEEYKMSVKTISMSSVLLNCVVLNNAIVVFEEVKEND